MPATSNDHGRAIRWLAGTGAACLTASLLPLAMGGVATAATPLPITTVNDPPATGHALDTFPARDFLTADGLAPGDTVVFEVTHSEARGGATIASKPTEVDEHGIAEVNHPGAACWDVVTPNIVAGDTVRAIVTASPNGTPLGTADQTHVAEVTTHRPVNSAPGTITLTGIAKSETGTQYTDLTALEARLVAPGKTFAKTQKRDMRAPGTRGATLAYDEPGSATNFAWTATFTGLTDADVKLALGAEAMLAWLGRDPAAGVESTVFETGAGIAGGPQAPCDAPKEKLPALPGEDAEAPTVPAGLTAKMSGGNTVTLDWSAATDNEGVTNYGVYRNGAPIFTVQNADAGAPAPTTFVDTNVPPGDYVYTVDAADAIDNRSAESDGAEATTTAVGADTVPVVEPPKHPFVLFPSRDMMDIEGIGPDQSVRVEVIRDGKVITSASGLSADDAGLVEINHVGTNCWSGTTPDLRANDIVRATIYAADGTVAAVEQVHTANLVVTKATSPATGVVEAKGEAYGHDGARIPLEQLDHRLVSSTAVPFGKTGKRSIRADSTGTQQGTITYDAIDPVTNPAGGKFTVRYTGLDAKDVTLAQKVVSVGTWLGRDPALGVELTISETGGSDAPGPAAPDCVAPLEPIDTVAPSAPKVTATPNAATREVDLAWTPSTDNTYVYGYVVFQDGKQIARVGGDATTYTVTNVAPGSHTFQVAAFDSASAHGGGTTDVARLTAGQGTTYGNVSTKGVATPASSADVQAPTVPGNLQVTNPTNVDPVTGAATGTKNARLVFDPSSDDSGAAPEYEVYRDGVLLPTAVPTMNAQGKMTYTDQKLATGSTYRYAVLAKDAAGNKSAKTAEVSVTIEADAEAPVFVGTPAATVPDIHGKDVVITWQPATDNVGVTGYGVYRDGTRIAQVAGNVLSFKDVGLAPGTYKYKVDAVDSANNRSDRAAQPNQTAAIANDPPSAGHNVTAYPARDMVTADGYTTTDATGATVGQTVVVEVFRADASGAFKVVAQARTRATNAGLVEVNHSGPGCWGTAGFGNTPDVRPGDVVRVTPVDTDVPDQTTVSNVYVGTPIQTAADTVVIKGTAADAAGKPLPIGELEARIISNGVEFRLSGKKQLLAPGDGSIAYDTAGSTSWSATFKGLVAADVTRALGGELVINWLGRAPLANNELTIAENGPGIDGGPAAGTTCTAPLDPSAPLVSLSPTARLAFGDQGATPTTTSAAKPVVLSNSGSSPLSLSKVYVGGANPADFAVTPATLPATLAAGASVTVNVTFSPKAVGARAATLNFASNGANTAYQTISLTGNGTDAAAPTAPTGFVKNLTGTSITTAVPVTLKWNASATGTVSHYQLQKSVGGVAFADLPAGEQPASAKDNAGTTTPAATTVTQQLPTSVGNVRYQVRACNGPNCSAWVALAAFSLVDFQENNGSISTRGTWTRSALAGSFGGSVSTNTGVAGDNVTLKTTGVGFQVIATKGPDRGNAEVWIDGTRRTSVNLYAASVTPAQVVATVEGLANATHSVELRVLGNRTAPSTANRVDIDGFIALR